MIEVKDRAEALRGRVRALEGVPVTYGCDDCSTWPAQWVADVTGRGFDWPAYATEDEVRDAIAAAGGLVNIWRKVARDAGLVERAGDAPVLGDVGVIDTRLAGPVGGIFADGGVFCLRTTEGTRLLRPRPHTIIAAWEVA